MHIYIFALPFRFWKYLFHRDLIVLLKYIFYSIDLWRWYLTENSLFVFTVVGDEVSIKIMLSGLTQPGFLLQPYMVLFKALQLWLYSSKAALSIFYIQSVTRTVYKRQGKNAPQFSDWKPKHDVNFHLCLGACLLPAAVHQKSRTHAVFLL